MIDPFLTEALARLDRWLLRVCDEEERRAQRLAGDGASGWDGVRNLARPTAGELALLPAPEEPPALPRGRHALCRVQELLGLGDGESMVLLLLLAPHLEPRYRALYGVLQDDLSQGFVTERLVLTVLGRSPAERRVLTDSLGEGGRLVASGLVKRLPGAHPPQGQPLALAPEVRDVLLGVDRILVPGATELRLWAAAPGAADGPEPPDFAVLHGSGDAVARARQLAAPAAVLHVGVPAAVGDAGAVLQGAWRAGLLHGVLPLADISGLSANDAADAARVLRGLVRGLGGRAWLVAAEPLPVPAPHFEVLSAAWGARRDLWLAEAARQELELSVEAAGRLATAHRLDREGVQEVFAALRRQGGPVDEAALGRVARHLGHRPVRHGIAVPTRRTVDDLVLRDTTRQALERLVFYVRHRDAVAEARGLERRYRLQRGPVALFSGRSGTGKTLAAEVVAGDLGRPLHVVDLARLVSKYIGETEKNIDEVLTLGERAGAVLFFDEADALFSARTEVSSSNDRYANLEVGYLLQRIERHDGLVILATNLRQAIDDAFLRRFQFRIEFPFPEPGERERIWSLMLPDSLPRADGLDLSVLAREHRLAGGDIRNAALKAIFLAEQRGEPLAQAHLDEAVALEMLELGRLSRRADAPGATEGDLDRGALLRRLVEALQDELEAYLRPRFLKEIHIIHGSPTRETLAGRRPGVNVALFRMEGSRSGGGLRLGFVVSAWSNRAEEEHELLGVVHECLSALPVSRLGGREVRLRVQESCDFDLLHRFWSSHGHPVRASVVADAEVR